MSSALARDFRIQQREPSRPIEAAASNLMLMSQYPSPAHQVSVLSFGQMMALMMLKTFSRTIQSTIEDAGRLRFLMCHTSAGTERTRAKKDNVTSRIDPAEVDS